MACKVFFSITLTLLHSKTANATNISATINPSVDIDCGSVLSIDDTCNVMCNLTSPKIPNLYCRNAGHCIIHCHGSYCLFETNVYATNTSNFRLISIAEGCVEGAQIYLPDDGDATIIGDASIPLVQPSAVLDAVSIYAGSHTDNIHIYCKGYPGGWDCYGMNIDASNANYLQIVINNSEFSGSADNKWPQIVRCPINSTLSPSCIIDTDAAITTENLQIFADKGMPQDVIFYSNGAGDYTATTITCSVGQSNINNDNTFVGTPCYITLNPTSFPTRDPTLFPTCYPTIYPTFHAISSITTSLPSINPSRAVYNTVITREVAEFTTNDSYIERDIDILESNHNVIMVIALLIILIAVCASALVVIRKWFHKNRKISVETTKKMTVEMAALSPDVKIITKWLKTKAELPQYLDNFLNNGYDTVNAVLAIKDKEELKAIGIDMMGHRTLLLSEIEKLQRVAKRKQKKNKQQQPEGNRNYIISDTIEIKHISDNKFKENSKMVDTDSEEIDDDVMLQNIEDFIKTKGNDDGDLYNEALVKGTGDDEASEHVEEEDVVVNNKDMKAPAQEENIVDKQPVTLIYYNNSTAHYR